ncbi:MAG: type II toxin-antitoxin system HicB family antitoxin [Rickettsiales bacterium]|mgnify:CR=1 FL=1
MHNVKYVIYKEGKYFVTKCLNFELSTFGETLDEAQKNMKEALELYFEDAAVIPPKGGIYTKLLAAVQDFWHGCQPTLA